MAQINMYLTGSKTYLKCKIIDHLIGKYSTYFIYLVNILLIPLSFPLFLVV